MRKIRHSVLPITLTSEDDLDWDADSFSFEFELGLAPEFEVNLKSKKVQKYWNSNYKKIDYSNMDQNIIRKFEGSHPKIIRSWLPKERGVFATDPNYQLTANFIAVV